MCRALYTEGRKLTYRLLECTTNADQLFSHAMKLREPAEILQAIEPCLMMFTAAVAQVASEPASPCDEERE